eukprot:TRINITY_DN27063_c0_g1_i1.p1 TRINITY_DN27063_c0_g1~~TRINITY_DN27063_c0_g1_i1.p1  ORF type:complete len:552 (+),score=72.20 TRINITY_DN27063_c0_g1_i1:73-1728(+)
MVRLPSGAFGRRDGPRLPAGFGWEDACSAFDGKCSSPLMAPTSPCLPSSPLLPSGNSARRRLQDEYDLDDEVIGTGGFGSVRSARPLGDSPSLAKVAVKSVPKRLRAGAALARAEANILRSLEHPSICGFKDIFEDDEHVHLVLEHIDGHELFEEIEALQPLAPPRARAVVRQLIQALAYCHERDVIHRDVKPENIMIHSARDDDAEPAATLIDFGLATACSDEVRTAVVGTAEYLAPECVSRGVFSRASDMWSVGVVLHMLLTGGALPSFKEDELVLDHPNVSPVAHEFVARLLQMQPELRMTAAEALQHSWMLRADHSLSLQRNPLSGVCVQDKQVASLAAMQDSENRTPLSSVCVQAKRVAPVGATQVSESQFVPAERRRTALVAELSRPSPAQQEDDEELCQAWQSTVSDLRKEHNALAEPFMHTLSRPHPHTHEEVRTHATRRSSSTGTEHKEHKEDKENLKFENMCDLRKVVMDQWSGIMDSRSKVSLGGQFVSSGVSPIECSKTLLQVNCQRSSRQLMNRHHRRIALRQACKPRRCDRRPLLLR